MAIPMMQCNLAQIAAEASFLFERFDEQLFQVDTTQLNEQQTSDRLAHWCQVVTQGDWEKFQQRLEWDGLDLDRVRSVLGTVRFLDSQILPTWTQTLKAIIQTTSNLAIEYKLQDFSNIPIDPENPLPFEGVLLPIVLVARQKLFTHLNSSSSSTDETPLRLLHDEAYLNLERSLLQKLVKLSVKTLEFEFSHSRPLGNSLLSAIAGEQLNTSSKVYYSAFVENLLQDGLLALFQKYPVLARLIATTIDFWVEATAEFLQRLKTDLPQIQQVFSHSQQPQLANLVPTTELGKVLEIEAALSDSHNEHRCVIALTFESGLKLVYKPRDLGLEMVYNQLLDWCNRQGLPLALQVLKVLNYQDYGWMEYVEHLPCADEAAAQRFYQRAGMLLCLTNALGGTDFHFENLIASGEQPMLIDLETLTELRVKPMSDSWETAAAETIANQQIWDSVLRTGLLPLWEFSPNRRLAYDISALGSVDSDEFPALEWRWKSVNTDNMYQGYEAARTPIQLNVAILKGVALSPNNYLDELVIGFEQMYRLLVEQRQALLATTGPLVALKAQQVRFVFRSTKIYWVVVQNSLAPEFLRNGVDWSIELDILSLAFLTAQNQPYAWPILQFELRAMEQLDVPYFRVSADKDTLPLGLEPPIHQYFREPSYSQVLTRLKTLDEKDLTQQVAFIRGAFYAKLAQTPGMQQTLESDTSTLKDADVSQISLLSSEHLLEKSQAIAQEIQEQAIWASDGSVSWVGLGFVPTAECFQLQSLSLNLYDGKCGIALFLAMLDYVSGSSHYRDLALGALHSLRQILQTSDRGLVQRFAREMGIGGATGLGSLIYALVKISKCLQEAKLLEDAHGSANLITPELIAADQQYDVMLGSAGAILGLLALYGETGAPAVLEQALACAQHLLDHRISVDGAPRAWRNSMTSQPLTGFSHGAAGIAYALLRLYAVTHNQVYLEAAAEAIAYERHVFSTVVHNWPDFRSVTALNNQPGFVVSWCHGAPGIGLARLGGLSILQTKEIAQDLEVALQTTQKFSWQGVDHICCGNFGRIEVLLVAAQKLSRPQLQKAAQQQAAWVVARAAQTGTYQLFANLPGHVFSPNFFQGTAGIGYQLLRLAHPETVPSVLLWE